VPPQVLDVVADPTNAELAEIRQILPDLRGIEMKLLRQRLRRNGLHTRGVELGEAPEVHRQSVGGELGNLLVGGLPLVHRIHKRTPG
jgi:hypothetical protein